MQGLPVSPEMLMKLRGSWEKRADWDSVMLSASVCLLLWMYKSRGDCSSREGEFRPGGPPHIPGHGGGQGRETQEDQGDHQGIQDGPIQGRGVHSFGMDRPKAMPGGCDVGIPGEEKGRAWSPLQV